jgi:hypothetical protein
MCVVKDSVVIFFHYIGAASQCSTKEQKKFGGFYVMQTRSNDSVETRREPAPSI